MTKLFTDKVVSEYTTISAGIVFEFNNYLANPHPVFSFLFDDFKPIESVAINSLSITDFPKFSKFGSEPQTVYHNVEFALRSDFLDTANLSGKFDANILAHGNVDMFQQQIITHLKQRDVAYKLQETQKLIEKMQNTAYPFLGGREFFSDGHFTSNMLSLNYNRDSVENVTNGILQGISYLSGLQTQANDFPNFGMSNVGILGNGSFQLPFNKIMPITGNPYANADTVLYTSEYNTSYKAVTGFDNVLTDKQMIIFCRDADMYPIRGLQYGGLDFNFFGMGDDRIDKFVNMENPNSVVFNAKIDYELSPTNWFRAVLVEFA